MRRNKEIEIGGIEIRPNSTVSPNLVLTSDTNWALSEAPVYSSQYQLVYFKSYIAEQVYIHNVTKCDTSPYTSTDPGIPTTARLISLQTGES